MRFERLHPQFEFDRWSRAPGWLQGADPRAKACAILLLLLGISLCTPRSPVGVLQLYAGGCGVWLVTVVSTRLPAAGLFRRALLVLPFTLVYAAVSWLAGDGLRAVSVSFKALLSAQFAVLLAASTPMEQLLAGLGKWHAPPFLLTIVLLVYRYLFVIASQARRMQLAAEARGSQRAFRAVAGSAAVLFAKSQQRATGLHRAMLARGFQGTFPPLSPIRFRLRDLGLTAASVPVTVWLHWMGTR